MQSKRTFIRVSALAVSLTVAFATCISTDLGGTVTQDTTVEAYSHYADTEEGVREWNGVEITGGGFVSGIVTGQDVLYARTDVGGAYKYNYDTEEWEQLFAFISEEDKGFLSVEAIAIDPTDDDTVYFFCGCAYFSGARSAIFKTTDGGETFTEVDVTKLIQTHANGDGRQFGERLVVDPEDPNTVYCGGRTGGLIRSTDGGETWAYVDGFQELGLFSGTTNWPTWDTNVVSIVDADGTAYNSTNGVSSLAISDGKLFVGVSVQGKANVYVSSDNGETFEPLSDDLPTNSYPAKFNLDADGNLLISYAGALAFSGSGGCYRYNIASDTVDDISPCSSPMGTVYSDPNDSNKLLATTCGIGYSQLWHEDDWDTSSIAWGDIVYRSTDGGKTWSTIAPGNEQYWSGPLQADYLQTGGTSWIEGKAIHWSSSLVVDPKNPDKVWINSGNGVFTCDNIWSDLPQYYFHADGIEEVVALDMVSVPDGYVYSAIGDYDGFIHYSPTESQQYTPNIGSTVAIAYCPSDPDYMVRYPENQTETGYAYYSTDGGVTWTKMAGNAVGGKAAITQLEDGTHRIFHAVDGRLEYTDDLGATWTNCNLNGLYNQSVPYTLVDLENPAIVYAYGYYTNPYDPNDAPYYRLYVSTDYGKTFSSAINICTYDGCDSAARIAYLGEDDIILAGGWYGLYHVTNQGKTIDKLDVYYCKTVGYGAPKDDDSPNTLYMWGQPTSDDVEGIYASTDGGESWFRVNDDEHQFGGTGNGNFIVGDMNTYGTFYMSTVGAGIIYSRLVDGDVDPDTTTTTKVTTTTTSATTTATTAKEDYSLEGTVTETKGNDVTVELEDGTEVSINLDSVHFYDSLSVGDELTVEFSGATDEVVSVTAHGSGTTVSTDTTTVTTVSDTDATTSEGDASEGLLGDVNCDGTVDGRDLIMLKKYSLGLVELSEQATENADVTQDGTVDGRDLIVLKKYSLGLIDTL